MMQPGETHTQKKLQDMQMQPITFFSANAKCSTVTRTATCSTKRTSESPQPEFYRNLYAVTTAAEDESARSAGQSTEDEQAQHRNSGSKAGQC